MKWNDGHMVTPAASKFIEKMLGTHEMKNTASVKCPMNPSENDPHDNEKLNDEDALVYHRIVGSSLYVEPRNVTQYSKRGKHIRQTCLHSTTKTSVSYLKSIEILAGYHPL